MTLTKPNQDLKRDLQGVASDLKWSAVEMMRIAERLSLAGNEADAQAVTTRSETERPESSIFSFSKAISDASIFERV